jgi:hypothetical protein
VALLSLVAGACSTAGEIQASPDGDTAAGTEVSTPSLDLERLTGVPVDSADGDNNADGAGNQMGGGADNQMGVGADDGRLALPLTDDELLETIGQQLADGEGVGDLLDQIGPIDGLLDSFEGSLGDAADDAAIDTALGDILESVAGDGFGDSDSDSGSDSDGGFDLPLGDFGEPVALDEAAMLACSQVELAIDLVDGGDVNLVGERLASAASWAQASDLTAMNGWFDSLVDAGQGGDVDIITLIGFLTLCSQGGYEL